MQVHTNHDGNVLNASVANRGQPDRVQTGLFEGMVDLMAARGEAVAEIPRRQRIALDADGLECEGVQEPRDFRTFLVVTVVNLNHHVTVDAFCFGRLDAQRSLGGTCVGNTSLNQCAAAKTHAKHGQKQG